MSDNENKKSHSFKKIFKKFILIPLIIVVALVLTCVIWGVAVNNSAISYEEQIGESKSSIDIQVSKRNETIMMLVQVVEKYDEHEQAIITAVAEARKDMVAGDIEGATTQLKIIVEQYPQIQSAENYRTLMLEISQCENQIARYQDNYNLQVKGYKNHVRKFPNKQFLSVAGYEVMEVDYLDLAGHNNLDLSNIFGN